MVFGGQTPHTSPGSAPKNTKGMPADTHAHRRKTQYNHGHPIAFVPLWKCDTDSDLLTLFNSMFHFPNQHSGIVFGLNCKLVTHLTLALQMKPFKLDGWRQLPKVRRHVGNIGAHLWEWILTFSTHRSRHESNASQGSQHKQDWVTTDKDDKSKVAWSLA
jgi:hypothetical protein